jgi:hypothetical protein
MKNPVIKNAKHSSELKFPRQVFKLSEFQLDMIRKVKDYEKIKADY